MSPWTWSNQGKLHLDGINTLLRYIVKIILQLKWKQNKNQKGTNKHKTKNIYFFDRKVTKSNIGHVNNPWCPSYNVCTSDFSILIMLYSKQCLYPWVFNKRNIGEPRCKKSSIRWPWLLIFNGFITGSLNNLNKKRREFCYTWLVVSVRPWQMILKWKRFFANVQACDRIVQSSRFTNLK